MENSKRKNLCFSYTEDMKEEKRREEKRREAQKHTFSLCGPAIKEASILLPQFSV